MSNIAVPLYQAEDAIRTHLGVLDSETLSLLLALGRTLREPILHPEPEMPPVPEGGEPIPQTKVKVLVEAGVRLAPHHIAAATLLGIQQVVVSQQPRLRVESASPASPPAMATLHAVRQMLSGFAIIEENADDRPHAVIYIGTLTEKADDQEKWPVQSLAAIPGKAFSLGVDPEKGPTAFYLPPVPLTALILCRRLLVPALLMCQKAEVPRTLSMSLTRSLRLARPETLFQPVRIQTDYHGERTAEPIPMKDLGDVDLLAQSDGFVEMVDHIDYHPAGDLISYYPWG